MNTLARRESDRTFNAALRAILRESEAKLEMKNYNPPSFFVRR